MKQANTALVRMDKIGDLVLSLNCDQATELKDFDVTWIISQGLEFIPESSIPKRKYASFPKHFSLKNFCHLWKFIRKQNFQLSIIFHAPWWVSLAFFLAGVKVRTGRLSQWHSFLFFNKGVRQKRSLGQLHESDYNLQLIQTALGSTYSNSTLEPLVLKAAPEVHKIQQLQLDDFCVVHPGMAGSALNWSLENYTLFTDALSKKFPVVITGTVNDDFILKPLKERLKNLENITWLNEKLNIQQLMLLLSRAKFVFAPSTGIIHLAASLGTQCFGLYSPIVVESQKRWGPKGPKVFVFEPTDDYQKYYAKEIMNKVEPAKVLQKIELHLGPDSE